MENKKRKTGIENRGKRPNPSIFEKIKIHSRGKGLDSYRFMYYIPPINQYAVLKNGWDIDYIDLAIFFSIKEFINSGKCEKFIDNSNVAWYWVAEGKIIKDLPLIPINSESSISNRITKLCKCGLIERNPDNKKNGKKHLRLGENIDKLTRNSSNNNSD